MAYFDAPLREAESVLRHLQLAHTDLSSAWRDPTGRNFVRDSLAPVIDRSKQMLEVLQMLQALEGRVRSL